MTAIRPRRSVLYMPGSNARAIGKAKILPADGVIFDLEDAVAPDAKAAARDQVCAAVAKGGYGDRELVIRVNGMDTEWWRHDMEAALRARPGAILLPKVESVKQLRDADRVVRHHDSSGDIALWAMMETPLGVLHADDIAGYSGRLQCLVLGTSDLTKDLHAQHVPDRMPLLYALSKCLMAARAFGLAVLDGVHLDLDDMNGFVAACEQGRAMGFDGKTLIHPKQIDPCNDVFAPSQAQVEHAHKVIAAYQEAVRQGKGVVVVDGALVENLHVENAQRMASLHAAIERLSRG
ncbi:MAG: CoA ester lyase [Sneathiellaceae bacterium]